MDSRATRCNKLIKKIQRGDERALDDLYKEFGGLFLNMAKKYLFDKSYAEDLLSEVFVDLVRTSAKSFDETKNGLNWIFTIIRRKAYRFNGDVKNDLSIEDEESQTYLAPFLAEEENPSSDRALEAETLRQAMKKLSDEENAILYYKYWEGLTVREIAKRLDKPRSTIQYKIDECMKKLQRELGPWE